MRKIDTLGEVYLNIEGALGALIIDFVIMCRGLRLEKIIGNRVTWTGLQG